MTDVLISKLFRTDWSRWNSKWLGLGGSMTLITIGVVANLYLINYHSDLMIVNSFFLLGFALFVVIPGLVGLAIVDGSWIATPCRDDFVAVSYSLLHDYEINSDLSNSGH